MEWGRITSGFGYRPNFGRMHKGIDVAMNPGDTVFAPLSGRVRDCRQNTADIRFFGYLIMFLMIF